MNTKLEDAKKIVELISSIAEARAIININIFCEDAQKAVNNTEILKIREQKLVDFLASPKENIKEE